MAAITYSEIQISGFKSIETGCNWLCLWNVNPVNWVTIDWVRCYSVIWIKLVNFNVEDHLSCVRLLWISVILGHNIYLQGVR